MNIYDLKALKAAMAAVFVALWPRYRRLLATPAKSVEVPRHRLTCEHP